MNKKTKYLCDLAASYHDRFRHIAIYERDAGLLAIAAAILNGCAAIALAIRGRKK